MSPSRNRLSWLSVSLIAVLIAAYFLALHWIHRDTLDCIRWRFTTYDGISFRGDFWFKSGYQPKPAPWEKIVKNKSGQLYLSVPVDKSLLWYRKPFQTFRIVKQTSYKNGLLDGSTISFDDDGHETQIEQYRDGKDHGLYCSLDSEGSIKYLSSRKKNASDGPSISFSSDGHIVTSSVMSKGKINLRRTKSYEILYSTNGVPLQATIWAADGNRLGIGAYKDGTRWDGWFPEQMKAYHSFGRYEHGQYLESRPDWAEPE